MLAVFATFLPAPAFASNSAPSAQSSPDTSSLPDLGTPLRNASASIVPGPAGLSAQGRFNGIKLSVTPEYSKQTGVSLGVALASMLGEQAAVGMIANGGDDKKELLVNTGFRLGNSQQVILSAGRLKQSLDFSFPSGSERVTMAQDSAGVGYQLQLGWEFLRYLEVNGYVSRTASRTLADKTFAVDTATLYELWNDPRRIAGGRISGVQGRLGFTPLEGSLIKASLGYEQLRYDLLAGKESTHRPTTGLEWQQQLGQGFRLLAGAERFASQDRYSAGVQRSLADAGGSHSIGLNLIGVQGRHGQGDDRQVQLAYSYTFGQGAATHGMSMSGMPGNRVDNRSQPGETQGSRLLSAGNLLDQVALRPGYMPSRVVAKVDTTAAPTRLVVVDKTALPAGSSVDLATGTVTTPIGVAVIGIAAVTLNGGAFANAGQFALSGNNLVIDTQRIAQPAAGVTDSYVVTVNNAGGGATVVTVLVSKGSVKIVSISIAAVTDTTPDAFNFTDVSNQALSTQVESNAITVAGISAASAISITGGEYQINGGTWTSSAGTVTNGQTVKVRHTTSAGNSTATNTTLTIGGVSDTFTSTTLALPAGYISQGGLIWSPNNATVPSGSATWGTANTYCSTATINGQTGWRLPTSTELSSLYSSGALAGQGWTLNFTWSSTPLGAGSHYGVGLHYGGVNWYGDSDNLFVTCVR